MNFEIKSFDGAGVIKFGMTQQAVSSLPLGRMRSFRRTPSEIFASDHFTDIGVVVSYKAPGVVEAIEFSNGSSPILAGVDLLSLSPEKLKEFLLIYDSNLKVEEDGLISHGVGIGAYVISSDEDGAQGKVVSIIVFESGYYD